MTINDKKRDDVSIIDALSFEKLISFSQNAPTADTPHGSASVVVFYLHYLIFFKYIFKLY